MGCDDEKLSKYLTHTFMAHCHTMICQQVTLSGEAEWPKVADAVIEALKARAFNMCGDVAAPNLYAVAQQNCLQTPDTRMTVMG